MATATTAVRVPKIDALIAALEWLGTYEGDEGTLADGFIAGIPDDMVAGYDELVRQINALYYEQAVTAISARLVREHGVDPRAAGQRARQYVSRNRAEFPSV